MEPGDQMVFQLVVAFHQLPQLAFVGRTHCQCFADLAFKDEVRRPVDEAAAADVADGVVQEFVQLQHWIVERAVIHALVEELLVRFESYRFGL